MTRLMEPYYSGDTPTDGGCDVLYGPELFECALCEPEDRIWSRDGAPVVRELNRLAETIDKLRAELAAARARIAELRGELGIIANATPSQWEPDMRDQFRAWAQNRARQALALGSGAENQEATDGD